MRYSKQRKVILEDLKGRTDHPTAEMVYQSVIKQIPGMGIATVYRNLSTLDKAGAILRIPGKDSPDRFDGNVDKHYHIRCKHCGKLEDMEMVDSEKFLAAQKELKSAFGLQDEAVEFGDVLFEYICSECKEDSCS